MNTTHKVPVVPLEKYKRTKIIATVGPSTDSYEAVLAIIKAGANGIRLNFSHGDHEEHGRRIKWVRKASREYGKPVAIIQDLQGPKIRLGDFEGIINVQEGQELRLSYKADYEKTGIIPVQYDLSKKVNFYALPEKKQKELMLKAAKSANEQQKALEARYLKLQVQK